MTINLKYDWCEHNAKTDKEFLGWIYTRLQSKGDRLTDAWMQRLETIINNMDGIIPDKMTKKLENNPELKDIREDFRKALADLGHSEATCYSHWALEAFDIANGLR